MKTKLFVILIIILVFAAVINAGNVIVKNGRLNVSGTGMLRLAGATDWGLETNQAPALQIMDRTNNIRRGIFDTSGNVYLGGSITNVNGDDATISILSSGRVGIGTGSPSEALEVNGDVSANAFIGDGSQLTNVPTGTSVPSGMIALFDTSCPSGWTRVSALDGKFLVSSSSYNAVAGGANSITLAIANLPSHTHGVGTLSNADNGNHRHSIDTCVNCGGGAGMDIIEGSGRTQYSNYAGTHSHTISGNTGATGSGTAFDNRPEYATIILCKKD